MKANEAPERLYLSKTIYSTYLYQVPDPDDETAVEYVREDAFIEKAAKWLEDNAIEYWGTEAVDNGMMIDDFKKAMKL